jgi:hypothetical protein
VWSRQFQPVRIRDADWTSAWAFALSADQVIVRVAARAHSTQLLSRLGRLTGEGRQPMSGRAAQAGR